MPADFTNEPASRPGIALFAGAVVLAATAAWIASSGGFRLVVAGVAVSARAWWPAGAGAVLLLAILAALRGRRASFDARVVDASLNRRAAACALTVAAAAFAAAAWFGSSVAGGADSSGYLSQAASWRRGTLVEPVPTTLAGHAVPAWVFSPLGYRPGTTAGTIVPSYPPGLPVQFALASLAGERAIGLVVPLLAAVATWCAFVLGRRGGGDAAGMAAAALTASSATFLYQAVQPMSDVPVTAWWLVAFAALAGPGRRRFLLSGLAAGIAIATRPNLAPALLVVPFFARLGPAAPHTHARVRPAVRATWFLAGLVPPVLLLAWFNTHLYGVPWASGYGDAGQLFSSSHVATNVLRYGSWLIDTHAVLLALAAVGCALGVAAPRDPSEGWLAAGAVTFSAIVAACYAAYAPFESWTYTRFLLPALALATVPAAIALARAARLVPPLPRVLLFAAGLALMAGHSVGIARARGAFDLADGERRYRQVADWVREHTPEEALVLCVQHSGSVHHTSGRTVIRWDMLDPTVLTCGEPGCADGLVTDRAPGTPHRRAQASAPADSALAPVAGQRPTTAPRPLVIVLDADEEPAFRQRFGDALPWGQLDWPPRAATAPPSAARVYLVVDRGTYAQGHVVQTDLLAGSR